MSLSVINYEICKINSRQKMEKVKLFFSEEKIPRSKSQNLAMLIDKLNVTPPERSTKGLHVDLTNIQINKIPIQRIIKEECKQTRTDQTLSLMYTASPLTKLQKNQLTNFSTTNRLIEQHKKTTDTLYKIEHRLSN